MINFRNLLIFCFLLIFSVGCDTDKYFSSNLSFSANTDSATVSGRVIRLDNRKPVAGAYVQFGYNYAITNNDGQFQIDLIYSNDDEKNLPSPIRITAPKYLDYYGQVFILPVPQEFQFELKWRPPIVNRFAYLQNPSYSQERIFQVLIRDYEGASNIDSVYTFLYKINTPTEPSRKIEIPFHYKWTVDSITAFYQTDKFDDLLGSGTGDINIPIVASDKSGFVDTVVVRRFFIFLPDSPIYPVSW